MKDSPGVSVRHPWRKEPLLLIIMIIGITTLAVVLSLILSVAKSRPPPLLLTPFLEDGNVRKAREASHVETDVIPSSHAGFITVNKTLGNHLFFWFFPALENVNFSNSSSSSSSSSSKPRCQANDVVNPPPLLLWLNGGPGVSSMLGLFWEHGPLEVVPAQRKGEPATFKRRCITWAKHYSIIYVDNPVGVGYSFSDKGVNGYRLTQDGYSMDLEVFVEQFFVMFPEYLKSDFYIGGQSYAGRYVPSLSYRIHKKIEQGVSNIPLKGIYLGGPYYDCRNQMKPFYEYLYSVGVISHADMVRYKDSVSKLYDDFLKGRTKNLTLVQIFPTLVPKEVGVKSMDNYVSGEEANYASITSVMTSDVMRRLLRVGDLSYVCISNEDFFGLYGEDIFEPCTKKLAVLLDNYKVLIYTGDFDVVVSSRMVDEALIRTPWSLQDQFNNTSRFPWKDEKTGEVLGFYSVTGRFCRVVVHKAGHQVPHDRPESSLRMMMEFIEHGCVGVK